MRSMSVPRIHARVLLSTFTSYHFTATESDLTDTESSISTVVPSWRSTASSLRSFGARGDVLSNVDGSITTAMLREVE